MSFVDAAKLSAGTKPYVEVSVDGPKQKFRYWEKDATLLTKIGVVATQVFIAIAATGLFLYNAPLFFPLLFVGILLHDPLDKAFTYLDGVYKISRVAFIAIATTATLLAFPTSTWVICGIVALWCGHRLVDVYLSNSENIPPPRQSEPPQSLLPA